MKATAFTAALAAAVVALSAPALRAEVSPQSIVDNLNAEGFSQIEITTGPTQVRAEAYDGTQRIEVVYDRATGAILSQETTRTRTRAEVQARVEMNTSSEDFDSDSPDDHGTGADDSADDGSSDHGGSGAGSDDSGADDNGSDDNGSGGGSSDHGGSGDHGGSDHDGGDGSDD